jgi:hypothetical protein
MGKIKQGILGGFLGKVGNVVGGNFKGIATMRAMPLSVANPRTAAQVGNRSRFSFVTAWAKDLGLPFIQTFWNRQAMKMSGFNLFCSVNKATWNASGAYQVEDAIYSQGVIDAPTPSSCVFDISNAQLTGSVSYAISGERLPTDVYNIIFVDVNGNVIQVSDDIPAEFVNFQVPVYKELVNQADFHYVYAVSRRADGTKTSNTKWTTCGIQA